MSETSEWLHRKENFIWICCPCLVFIIVTYISPYTLEIIDSILLWMVAIFTFHAMLETSEIEQLKRRNRELNDQLNERNAESNVRNARLNERNAESNELNAELNELKCKILPRPVMKQEETLQAHPLQVHPLQEWMRQDSELHKFEIQSLERRHKLDIEHMNSLNEKLKRRHKVDNEQMKNQIEKMQTFHGAELERLESETFLKERANRGRRLNATLKDTSEELLTSLENLLTSKDSHSDFIIETKLKTFHVHKSILSARSSVFRTMLESPQKMAKIKDISLTAVREMLRFLYSGRVSPIDLNKFPDLFRAADRFNITSLKNICSKELIEGLSTRNAVSSLVLADEHKDSPLINAAVEYIATNMSSIQKGNDWEKLLKSHPHLVKVIVQKLIKN